MPQPPDQQSQALTDPSLQAVVLLTTEVKVNTSAVVELSKRIYHLEISLSGEGQDAGLKTKVFLLEQTIKSMKESQVDTKNFKMNLYVAIFVWLLSIVYNILPHTKP